MKLVAFGDSFVHGLVSDPHRTNPKESAQISFIRHLVDKCDEFSEFENHAVPGTGNDHIAHTVYKYIMQNPAGIENTFFFVGWTTSIRTSFWHNKHEYLATTPADPTTRNNEAFEAFNSENAILGIDNLLSKLGIPYLMIQAFDDIKKAPFNFTGNITQTMSALNLLDLPHWIEHSKTNNTLMDIIHKEWLSNKDYLVKGKRYHNQYGLKNELIAPCFHPSRLGHEVIADTLLPYVIQELNRYNNVSD